MPRRRFQRGRIFERGKRQSHWFGSFREDVTVDGVTKRMRRTVKLGPVNSMSKRTATAMFQRYLDRVNSAVVLTPKSGKTLCTFVAEWRGQIGIHQSASSLRAVESHLRAHILLHFGEQLLTEIDTRTVQLFVTKLSESGCSRKTIENILGTLSGLLRSAKRFGYATSSFSREDLTLPRRLRTEACYLTVGQIGKIVAFVSEPYSTMFFLLGMTGLRAGELLALRVTDLDFQSKVIHIRRSLDLRTRQSQPTKSEASMASIPMPVELENRLNRYLQLNGAGVDSLFVNRNGRPFSRGNLVSRVLWPAQDACGIARTGLHAFRHGLSSELLNAGAAPSIVQRQLRHSNPRVTLEHYSHVVGESHREAIEKLAKRVNWSQVPELESTSS